MKADTYPAFLGRRRDLFKKGDEIGAKIRCRQLVILGNRGADALAPVRQFGTG